MKQKGNQFHTQPPTKKPPLKVDVEVIKKAPPAESSQALCLVQQQ